MKTVIAFAVLCALSALAFAQELQPRTFFRHAHTIIILGEKDRPFELTLYALSASLGYPDPLNFRLTSPQGKTLEQGTIKAGEARALRVAPNVAGLFRLMADPGQNAFGLTLQGATWLAEMKNGEYVEVIDRAAPLYFFVPKGTESFEITASGEGARLWLLDPDGRAVAEAEYPNYQKATLRVRVAPAQAGRCWQVKVDLTEDCMLQFTSDVLPYLSEMPIAEETLARLQREPGTIVFDRQLTDREVLLPLKVGLVAAAFEVGKGLRLNFDAAGRVWLSQSQANAVLPSGLAAGGFLLRDFAKANALLRPSLKVEWAGLSGRDEAHGLELRASMQSDEGGLRVTGVLSDTTGKDRAITLYFALPVPREGAWWWEDLDHKRLAEGRTELMQGATIGCGSAGFHSTYPWGCVTGTPSVAMAIPLNRPCLHRIGYNPTAQLLFLALDFTLTPATKKFPQRAEFSFVIYQIDGEWGFRSAAEHYYRLFPESFDGRMKEYGGWACWGNLSTVNNPKDLGFLYHLGPSGPPAVKWDNEHGLYSFLYNDSCRYFADIGAYEKKPDAKEVARVFREYLNSPDPAAFVKSRPDKATGKQRYLSLEKKWGAEAVQAYLRRCVDAVKRSAAEDAEGNFVTGYVINRKDWGPPNWWTGRLHCNIDPDLEGGYGRFLLDEIIFRTFEEYEKEGGVLGGVGLDNYFVNAAYPDFRREHFASVDFPLTFNNTDGRPMLLGDFTMCEWVAELRKRLGPKRAVIANLVVFPFPFAAHYLDIHGYEWNIERVAPVARVLAFRKPVVTLPVKEEHYDEPFIKAHLRFGAIPGGYADKRFNDPKLRALYMKYVPILLRMNRAGWQPIPYARCNNPEVFVERFGPGEAGELFYSVHNAAGEAAKVRVEFLGQGKPWTGLRDAIAGSEVSFSRKDDRYDIELELSAGETKVLAAQ